MGSLRSPDRLPKSRVPIVIIEIGDDNMIRTQISLNEREYELAKAQARRLGISLAELMRRAIRDVLPADDSKPWMRYAGFIESGNTRSSRTIDDIVYGPKD